jgi:transposase-like protein
MDPVLTPEELDQALEAHRWTARDWARSDGAALLASWAAAGATLPQIAKRIGITVSTLRRWRATHVEIAHALDEADDLATTKVEAALYKRALGYTFQEVTEEEKETPLGTTTTTRTITKHKAPDTKAAIFWLKNRAPDRWSDRTEVDHTITVMEEQATELMAVMDTALDQLGLTAAQRAALPDAVAQALKARGLVPDDERVIDGQIVAS